MSRRNRVFLGILALFAALVGTLLYRVAADIDTRYRESAEDSLVDTAYLLASVIENDMRAGIFDLDRLEGAFQGAYRRRFEARIFGIVKQQVDVRAYVTDAQGHVVFDSLGQLQGMDMSEWRDVKLALAGEYGARTSLDDPARPDSSVMYVAVPLRDEDRIVGVLALGKPVASQQERVATARQKLLSVGLITLAAFLLLLIGFSVWLARPLGLTGDVLRIARQEGLRNHRRLLSRTGAAVRGAFVDMRDALAGRSYTEEYIQTLTHEIKSPLAAIRGAAELMREPAMPEAERARFGANIEEQVQRLQDLADRLLELASLEKRRLLEAVDLIPVRALLGEAADLLRPQAERKGVVLQSLPVDEALRVRGDPFLLKQALVNLVANAVEFSPAGGTVTLEAAAAGGSVRLTVRDHGAGIPDYAIDHVFEKFYSLRRPDSGRKSTGLGLAFVREIAQLHGGGITVANHAQQGVIATLTLPLADYAA